MTDAITIIAHAQHAQDNVALIELGARGVILTFDNLPARDRSSYRQDAKLIVTALDAAGYAIVPKDPTDDMLAAGALVIFNTRYDPVSAITISPAYLGCHGRSRSSKAMIHLTPISDRTEEEISIPPVPTDKRIAWCESSIKGFREMRAVAERVRQEAAFSRAALAARQEERAA